ncbi:hypothetical protein [Mucilaginibacter phyllosphaerae]|uniref:Restriction endonuclease n=1 Tax=Mucilaginibacter phyllosphaerae TaxID=1812349 RepID=A0A4Y8AFC8_9SPHI|nr:hypothetical protein [Mucilaginibacter phyllosphaerae]MBB3970360.1 hypothetical protein [Mucilaginibacter phyllosphaerae]TEW66729.1 hypothetical protein E2R65_09935 [Mucilaginibacter phyllosphaerae]GGH11508.1 hypothetical protein GCM10007352_17810 [Mucilaginibacter phyllosphaerae]
MSIKRAESLQSKLQTSLDILIKKIGKIQIGTIKQFPLGWRKAAKGRTVWRIVEEVITQNLEKYYADLDMTSITVSDSETSIHDFAAIFKGEEKEIHVNIKTAVFGRRAQKDDISKGTGLKKFYEKDADGEFFIATFFLNFHEDMTIEIEKCVAFPIAWVPDLYINPSNNANLQSGKYKSLEYAQKREVSEFRVLFEEAMEIALKKRRAKLNS